MDVYLSLTEDVAVAIKRTVTTQVVGTTATAKHITVYMTAEDLNVRLARAVETFQ